MTSEPDIPTLESILDRWGTPPAWMVSTLPKGNTTINYLGHAETTRALIELDPEWRLDWIVDPDGMMRIVARGERLVSEGHLTLCGVTRPAIGTCKSSAFEPEKELYGDMLRNGAMRFGVGLSLWSKSDPAEHEVDVLWAQMIALDDDYKALLREWADSRDYSLDRGTLLREPAVRNAVAEWIPVER